jgi:hypothetical protein
VDADWDRLFEISLHPTQVEVLSAMEWLDVPLSPVQLAKVLDKGPSGVNHLSYHTRRLCSEGLLRLDSIRAVRGAVEHLYLLEGPPARDRPDDGPRSGGGSSLPELPSSSGDH